MRYFKIKGKLPWDEACARDDDKEKADECIDDDEWKVFCDAEFMKVIVYRKFLHLTKSSQIIDQNGFTFFLSLYTSYESEYIVNKSMNIQTIELNQLDEIDAWFFTNCYNYFSLGNGKISLRMRVQ